MLQSAARHQLTVTVPRARRSTFGTRAFATPSPKDWNSLPDYLRHPTVGPEQFRHDAFV